MTSSRLLAAGVAVAGSLVLLPAPSASAHVHLITPLICTPAPPNAGGNQVDLTPAGGTDGPITAGVIPINMGGNVPLRGGGFDAAACDH